MHQRANLRSTNIATKQKQTLYAQRKHCNPDAVSLIVSANSVIEQSYVPIEATVKSFILVVLVLVMISLLYLVLEIMANHYVAVLIVFVPIQLLSAGELYYRFPWIYYFSPFSWTRLSLNGELVNGFVYPSFGAKVTGLMFLIVVLTVVLTLINKKQNKYD